MLKPIQTQPQEIKRGSDSSIVQCEACGIAGPSHRMINFAIVIGSPGHEDLTGFQCPGSKQLPTDTSEHWACSPDCWKVVAHACIDEHMHMLLQYHRSKVGL